jgi:class I fructose-bisphosphate aldolase
MQKILSEYIHENPALRGNLYRIFSHGNLASTGKIIILPVDQGIEHGPDASFLSNPDAYDPLYHLRLAIDSGVSAYAAPLGMLEVAAAHYPGVIPMILKLNSSNSLKSKDSEPYQAIISDVEDAVKLGCVGVGITIYPGSNNCDDMLEQVQHIFQSAKTMGLVCIIWCYPRGAGIKDDIAFDTVCYAAHIGAITGAHIIKVKLPSENVTNTKLLDGYTELGINIQNLSERVKHVKKCAFDGRRIVLFSGGAAKESKSLVDEIKAIANGGGDGSIIGRNLFQRPKSEAIELVKEMSMQYIKSC